MMIIQEFPMIQLKRQKQMLTENTLSTKKAIEFTFIQMKTEKSESLTKRPMLLQSRSMIPTETL